MSISNTNVCRCLLKDNFGDLAETVGSLLLLKGACHLRQIAAETNIGLDKVCVNSLNFSLDVFPFDKVLSLKK